MKTDIEIAGEAKLFPINSIAQSIKIDEDELICYGKYMAKLEPKEGSSKLILVTAINPTSAGEGKTTISIGLADGLKRIGKKVCLALREPSLGPVFGIKGGATGGGYAQIAPMDDINLHFTGDLHAITAANNLLSAMIDNHMYWGNALKIKTVFWHRCIDMNDRALRYIEAGINYNERPDNFDITAASEIMAILCLSRDKQHLKEKLGNIIIGTNESGEYVTARDLKADEAMAILLKDAVKPNLVQSLEGVPAIVHGGPFANIAHGCNSIMATKTAMYYADYVVTEAGFGADLGAEKFLDIKCRTANIAPDAVVIVATIRALKCAGGKKENLSERDDAALSGGLANLIKHVENMTKVFSRKCVVAINRFDTDTDEEIDLLSCAVKQTGALIECASVWANGGEGGKTLAQAVIKICEEKSKPLTYAYELSDSIKDKIIKVATKIYGADGVIFSEKAEEKLAALKDEKWQSLPVCIAKTQYSLSDNPLLTGRPTGFKITVKDLNLRAGAGFIVALAGEILLMPGLSKIPNAEKMKIHADGKIDGLF